MNFCIPVFVRPLPLIEDSSLLVFYVVSIVNISEDRNLLYHRCESPKPRVCSSMNKVLYIVFIRT